MRLNVRNNVAELWSIQRTDILRSTKIADKMRSLKSLISGLKDGLLRQLVLHCERPLVNVGHGRCLVDVDRCKTIYGVDRSTSRKRGIGGTERADRVGDVVDGRIGSETTVLPTDAGRADVKVGIGRVLVTGERKALHAVGGANGRARGGSVGDADAGFEALPVDGPQVGAAIAAVRETEGRCKGVSIQSTGHIGTDEALIAVGLDARHLHLIPQAKVEGEVASNVPVVLEISGVIAPAI